MIFVCLGSQKFQFNRLLQSLDSLKLEEDIFAQIGYSDYKPKNFKWKEFLDNNEFIDAINKASIIITHGGAGTIINSIKRGKKVIAIPRLKRYGEHVDDHQTQIVEEFSKSGFIYGCMNCEDLEKALIEIDKMEFNKYISNTANIVDDLDKYIKSL